MGIDLGFVSFDDSGFHLKNPIDGTSIIDWDPMAEVNAWKNKIQGWMNSVARVLQEALSSFFGGLKSLITDVLMKAPTTVFSAIGGGIKKAFGKKGGDQ